MISTVNILLQPVNLKKKFSDENSNKFLKNAVVMTTTGLDIETYTHKPKKKKKLYFFLMNNLKDP